MDIWKYFSITHADLRILNPSSHQKLDELVELLEPPPDGRLLDIACGKGEFLVRAAGRWRCSAVGVDISPFFVADARDRVAESGLSDQVEVIQQNGADYEGESELFNVSLCLGASWIWEGYSGTLDALARWTRPGGLIISGEPYWKKAPDAAYCEADGHTPELFGTHEENVQTGLDKGLRFLHAIVSSEDDWDRYQGYQYRAAERYACAHPDDADIPELLKGSHRDRDSYLKWGRDTLGWAIYLFLKEPFIPGEKES